MKPSFFKFMTGGALVGLQSMAMVVYGYQWWNAITVGLVTAVVYGLGFSDGER